MDKEKKRPTKKQISNYEKQSDGCQRRGELEVKQGRGLRGHSP